MGATRFYGVCCPRQPSDFSFAYRPTRYHFNGPRWSDLNITSGLWIKKHAFSEMTPLMDFTFFCNEMVSLSLFMPDDLVFFHLGSGPKTRIISRVPLHTRFFTFLLPRWFFLPEIPVFARYMFDSRRMIQFFTPLSIQFLSLDEWDEAVSSHIMSCFLQTPPPLEKNLTCILRSSTLPFFNQTDPSFGNAPPVFRLVPPSQSRKEEC